MAAPGGRLAAQTVQSVVINREYTIKAAFLYHFLTYTEWPSAAAAGEPVKIGVFGADPFGEVLDKIADTKKANGRSIVVWRIDSPDQAAECHLVYVPRSADAEQESALMHAASSLPVMLVGESDGFVDRGGAAQFYLEGNRVRFAFNTDVVEEKKLKISSKLLSLAKIVTSAQTSK